MKKALSLLLAVCLSLGCFACNPEQSAGQIVYGTLLDATFWGTTATEKVLQDVHDIYDGVKTDASVDLTVAKGEKEGYQIIITAKEKPLRYTVTLDDLKSSDGTVFAKENIDLFHEKYIAIDADYAGTGVPIGMYADAIVPYQNIVDAGENIVEPTKNQGLYFRFDIPLTQKPGVYTGNAKITIGGQSKNVPISLNVLDIVVSEVNHAKSIFGNSGQNFKGEVDTTQHLMEKYNEALLDYRCCPSEILVQNGNTDEDIATWTDLAYEYMQNPKCSTVRLPSVAQTVSGQSAINVKVLTKYLKAVANKSFETGYNMFDKLVCYFTNLDEPGFQGTWPRVVVAAPLYKEMIKAVADDVEKDSSINSSIKADVVNGIRKLRNVITNEYDEEYAHLVDTWCPKFDYYDTALEREQYAEQEEKWWYGCTGPKNPYPAYMIDSTFYGMRIESWMKAEYNVVGNLYWSTTVSAKYNGHTKIYSDIEDYYGVGDRYPYSYGDGFLWYPGKKYGIDGPVATLRLEAIRDGLEEYELLYEMKNTYAEISDEMSKTSPASAFTFEKMIQSITSQIYTGTKVTANNDTYHTAREALFSLYAMNKNMNLCITDYFDNGYGTNTYTVVADGDATVKESGETLTANETVGAFKKYVIEKKRENVTNELSLTVEKEGKTLDFVQSIGGKVTINDADAIGVNNFGKEGVTPTAELVTSIIPERSGNMVKVSVPAVESSKAQSFTMKGGFINGVGKGADKMLVHIYYEGDDMVPFVISGKHKKTSLYMDLVSTKLVKGMNVIEIALASKSWDKLGELDYVIVYLGNKRGDPARTLYIYDSVVYAQ